MYGALLKNCGNDDIANNVNRIAPINQEKYRFVEGHLPEGRACDSSLDPTGPGM